MHKILKSLQCNPWRRLATALLGASLASASLVSAEVSTSELPVLTGTEVITIESKSVADTFVLYVRLPPEAVAEPKRTFPVIYALDGDHTFPMMASVVTQLGWSGAVPPSIIVGIGYGTLDLEKGNQRNRDLSPQAFPDLKDSGGGSAFLSFLIEEAIPQIESQYPADPTERYLFGHSLGGLFSLYAYAKCPEHFKGIIAGSPVLKDQLALISAIADKKDARSCRLFIATGADEDASLFIDDLDQLRAALDGGWAAPDSYEMVLIPGFEHFTMVAPSISKGLRSIFSPAAPD